MGKFISYLFAAGLMCSLVTTATAQEEVSAANLYNQGLEQLKAKNYGEALPLLEKAIEVADPEADAKVVQLAKRNGAIAAYKVGSSMRKEKDFEAALDAFNTGIEFAPGFYANYIGRAQSLEDNGQEVEALKAYLKAADVSKKGKKTDKAEQMYAKAENMVAVTYGDKKWDETKALAAAFLETSETPDVHYYMAAALKGGGDTAQAIEHAQKAVDSAEGDKSKYLMVLAESYEKAGQTAQALDAYKQVTGSKYAERAKFKVNELSGGK